jgi:hypothetical protein
MKAGGDLAAGAPAVANAAGTNAANKMTSAVNNLASSITPYTPSHYGSTMTDPTAAPPAAAATAQASTSPAASTAVAASQPWRPGGTSSYPTTSAAATTPDAVEVATRPDALATSTATSPTTTGGAATSPVISMPSSRY